jgi:predicted NAD/FAD-binding protein
MQIGVIGSGIAGLVSGRLLADSGHDVTLFERQSTVGMDGHATEITDSRTGNTVRADVPSRMVNSLQWPRLLQLYERLGIETVEVSASQSFAGFGDPAWLRLERANRPRLLNSALASSRARRVVGEARRLRQQGIADLQSGVPTQLTTAEYLESHRFSREFIREFLYPTLSSTVCTCSYASLDRYPARTILSILHNLTRDTRLLRTRHGTADVVRRLLTPRLRLRPGCQVQDVRRVGDAVQIACGRNEICCFDHVVVATQANTALALLPQLSTAERKVLSSFAYETVPVFVHRDTKLMPASPRDWSTFNMLVSPDKGAAMCSVWLNRFYTGWDLAEPVFQTINAFIAPEADKTIRHCVLQRPVVTTRTEQAWEWLEGQQRQPDRRIWFCGSYAGRGTPLLESGVNSAEAVVRAIRVNSEGALQAPSC